MTATVNAAQFAAACDELGLAVPPTYSIHKGNKSDGRLAYGDYHLASNHIRLFLGIDHYEYDGLRHAQMEVCRTMLHEMRHAYQKQKGKALSESDAEGWARANVSRYKGLVRLVRSFPNSGFSRLSRHDRQIV